MLPPMRPRPSIAICIGSSPDELHCLANGIDELARVAVLDVDAERAPPARLQNLEIATRLRGEERREAVWLPGNGEVLAAIARRLEEDAVVRAALVQLPGRMEEARAESGSAGEAGRLADEALLPVPLPMRRV